MTTLVEVGETVCKADRYQLYGESGESGCKTVLVETRGQGHGFELAVPVQVGEYQTLFSTQLLTQISRHIFDLARVSRTKSRYPSARSQTTRQCDRNRSLDRSWCPPAAVSARRRPGHRSMSPRSGCPPGREWGMSGRGGAAGPHDDRRRSLGCWQVGPRRCSVGRPRGRRPRPGVRPAPAPSSTGIDRPRRRGAPPSLSPAGYRRRTA